MSQYHYSLEHSIFSFFCLFCFFGLWSMVWHTTGMEFLTRLQNRWSSHSIKSRGRTSRRSDRLGIDSHLGRIHEKRHSMKSRLSSHSMKSRLSSHSTKSRLSSHSTKSRSRTSRRSDRLGIDSHLGRNRWSIPTNILLNLQINEGTIWCWRRRRLAKVNLESMAWKQR